MSSITLKDMPDYILERLRYVAHKDRRSLNQQAIVLLSRALEQPAAEPSSIAAQLSEWRELAGQWRSEQSFEEEVELLRKSRTRGRKVEL